MLRGKVKDNFMAGVTQKGGAGLHWLENTRLTFDPQVNVETFGLSYKPNQRFRLIGV